MSPSSTLHPTPQTVTSSISFLDSHSDRLVLGKVQVWPDKQEPVKFQLTPEGKQSGICFVKFSSLQVSCVSLFLNLVYFYRRPTAPSPRINSTWDNAMWKFSLPQLMKWLCAPHPLYAHINLSCFSLFVLQTATNWVRMRGLPFSATKGDILAFFAGFNLTEAGIFMVSGRAPLSKCGGFFFNTQVGSDVSNPRKVSLGKSIEGEGGVTLKGVFSHLHRRRRFKEILVWCPSVFLKTDWAGPAQTPFKQLGKSCWFFFFAFFEIIWSCLTSMLGSMAREGCPNLLSGFVGVGHILVLFKFISKNQK